MPEEYDRFADELDRMVAGQPPVGDSDLAAFAREVQGLGAERMDDEQRDRIRSGLAQHAATIPTAGGPGPISPPSLIDPGLANPWVRRISATAAPSDWRGHMVRAQTAIAIMTAVALLIVGAAWYTNQQDDDPNPSTTRYAAVPTENTSGLGDGPAMLRINDARTSITLQGSLWTEPISADECLPREVPVDADTSSGEVERAYGPLTTPLDRDSADAAMTLRRYQACLMANGSADGYVSDRFIAASPIALPNDKEQLRAAQEISEGYKQIGPDDFIVTITGPEATPLTSMRIEESPGVYQPRHARALPDGRIAIPSSRLLPGDYVSLLDDHIGNVYILTQANGAWVVDEMLLFCVGNCDDFWAGIERASTANSTPAGTPEVIARIDDRIWLACPDYTGPYTYASREVASSDAVLSGGIDPRSSWGPAVPPSIPCQYPKPVPPEIGKPIPLD